MGYCAVISLSFSSVTNVFFISHTPDFINFRINHGINFNKQATMAAACKIIMSGRPIIKRLCFVLCLIFIIVRYTPIEPPKIAKRKNVLSLIRKAPLLARFLSTMTRMDPMILISKMIASKI